MYGTARSGRVVAVIGRVQQYQDAAVTVIKQRLVMVGVGRRIEERTNAVVVPMLMDVRRSRDLLPHA